MATSPLPSNPSSTGGPAPFPIATANLTPGAIWLNGEVLGCACPVCAGPMSIRAWLMVGDCAVCGTSIELSLEQEAEVRRLLAARGQTAPPAKGAASAAKPTPPPPPAPAAKRAVPPPRPKRTVLAPPPLPKRTLAARPTFQFAARQLRLLASDALAFLPAWLVSLIVHLVLFIVMGLWALPKSEPPRNLVLSVVLGGRHLPGEAGPEEGPFDETDLAPTDDGPIDPWDDRRASRDAAQLQLPPSVPLLNLPPLTTVAQTLAVADRPRMFEGRDPRIRADLLAREGGTTYTEAAVARGLRWIARHQSPDGAWRLDAFGATAQCRGQCSAPGLPSDVAGTALALLPMLGAGQTHQQGRYRDHVQRGLAWLVNRQTAGGDLRGPGQDNMYAQGLATIALCEAYALSADPMLRGPAQRAIDFIVDAQHSAGGWRYQPGEPGDTSVVGWQLMALRSGKLGGLRVSDRSFDRAVRFLDRVQADRAGSLYGYQPGTPPTPAMTAEALLSRQYLGWPADHPGLQRGAAWMVDEHPPRPDEPNIYYWYYATQVLHHLGGPAWQRWNAAMRTTLVALQETQGHEAGSWTPRGGAIGDHDTRVGGRLYMTALAVCTLEVYYRHLPLYRPIDLAP